MLRSDQEQIFECEGHEDPVSLPPSIPTSTHEDVVVQPLNPLSSFDYFHAATLAGGLSSSAAAVADGGRRAVGVGRGTHNVMESPYERYLRLKLELNELSQDLQEMQDIQTQEKQSIWALLQEETKKLVIESEKLTTKFPAQLSEPSAVVGKGDQERLHNDILSDMQNKLQMISSSSSSTSTNTSGIVTTSSAANEKTFMALEQRVYRLETMLGIHSNYLDLQGLTTTGTNNETSGGMIPLVQIVTRLEQRLALLDSATLDSLRGKIVSLKNEISTATAGSGGSNSNNNNETLMKVFDAMKKLDYLFDNMTKIDAIVDELPIILTRLKTLEGIHWNASMFANRLQLMEQEMQSMTQEVANNQEVLEEIKMGLQENLQIMQENVQKVENRLSRANL